VHEAAGHAPHLGPIRHRLRDEFAPEVEAVHHRPLEPLRNVLGVAAERLALLDVRVVHALPPHAHAVGGGPVAEGEDELLQAHAPRLVLRAQLPPQVQAVPRAPVIEIGRDIDTDVDVDMGVDIDIDIDIDVDSHMHACTRTNDIDIDIDIDIDSHMHACTHVDSHMHACTPTNERQVRAEPTAPLLEVGGHPI
jgi:hypothetical protein